MPLASTSVADSGLIKVVPGLMIWTLITFGITFFVLRRFAFGPIQKAIDKRRDRIREAVDEADRARTEAEQFVVEQREALAKARADAEEMLAETRRVAEGQHRRLREELDAEREGDRLAGVDHPGVGSCEKTEHEALLLVFGLDGRADVDG